jgi:hypothetical protein
MQECISDGEDSIAVYPENLLLISRQLGAGESPFDIA